MARQRAGRLGEIRQIRARRGEARRTGEQTGASHGFLCTKAARKRRALGELLALPFGPRSCKSVQKLGAGASHICKINFG
ncbi:hypothetical protein EJB05_15442 [Eragrostis curvula]|uniref:Uncharacterized protein n=1 Tax=Eragrostis curvula TaxID=38414 RepID=A0A5J9W1W1_9POAL|nr:hypothetical protein EJB05_15442 [Eragrostis curvula]